ncbi:MAG TPA: hypothetical protein VH206_14565 [Xanthobacteraceae bacterium]|jgi:hypothetical protein|nr:hypothetical protein [Xanthobacteraceae bacterium]
MLNGITAALIATTLIAAPALAQTNNATAPAAPAAQTQMKTDKATTPKIDAQKPVAQTKVKHIAKHVTKHASKHASRGKTVHQARHVTKAKAHQANNVSKAAKRS